MDKGETPGSTMAPTRLVIKDPRQLGLPELLALAHVATLEGT